MTDRTDDWKTIFGDLTTDGVYEMCEINAYQLASHLEELYLQNQELWKKVEEIETQLKDVQVLEGKQIDYKGCYD
jgi:cell shape-determining protein MreC